MISKMLSKGFLVIYDLTGIKQKRNFWNEIKRFDFIQIKRGALFFPYEEKFKHKVRIGDSERTLPSLVKWDRKEAKFNALNCARTIKNYGVSVYCYEASQVEI